MIYEIPLTPSPQEFRITLGGIEYRITVKFQNVNEGGWFLDVADANGVALINGVPLVTGCDLLAQHKHLGFNGELRVQTSSDPDAVPTFENLGVQSHLYWITP